MDHDLKVISTEDLLARFEDGAVLSDLEIQEADLAQIAANHVTIRHCVFRNVDWTDADLEKISCHASQFINCRFLSANLEKATFDTCTFFDPDQSKSDNFTQANLRAATFKKCDLSGCIFEGADLSRITIQDSNVTGAKFFRARFQTTVKIVHNKMRYADLRGANLAKSDFSQNDLVWAALDEADFTEANLIGSDLSGATMRFTKFMGADLRGAGLGTMDLRSMDLQGAKILESQMRKLVENCELIVFPDGS